MFQLTEEKLEQQKAIHTAREIYQQPDVWKEIFSNFQVQRKSLQQFLTSIYEKHDRVRVIFTGAGTSAYVGDALVQELGKQNQEGIDFESIPTTDIVGNPMNYFQKNVPTILVSFARSGNSPESVATVNLAEQLIKELYQVVITCNKDGELAKNIVGDDNSRLVLLPEEANDKSFAMTSSYTGMLFAAYLLFTEMDLSESQFEKLTSNAKRLLDTITDKIEDILTVEFDRIVYLGSGIFSQLSKEASLKMLELTAGKVVTMSESSLGFRHGPKSTLNETSIVVLFMSKDSYTRKYDVDILKELSADGTKVVVLTEESNEELESLAEWVIAVDAIESDFLLSLLYIIFAQGVALKKSLQLGITPDNPSPDGRVNRVVKGVTIYPWNEQ